MERNLPSLSGRVFIVTGAKSNVGLELAKILYSRSASVGICGRYNKTTSSAIEEIRTSMKADGKLSALALDLANLSTIRPAGQGFLARESRLDVLFHNAGVMTPPAGSKTADGYDLELGTKCLAPFLMTRLLQPTLDKTARTAAAGTVRVVWVNSMVSVNTPKGGVQLELDGRPKQRGGMDNYMQTKAADVLMACEGERRGSSGVTSVSVHPGFLKTNLQRNMSAIQRSMMDVIFKDPKYGAYSELYAGLGPSVKGGCFYIPWGRLGEISPQLKRSSEPAAKGPSDASRIYDWCTLATEKYLGGAQVAK